MNTRVLTTMFYAAGASARCVIELVDSYTDPVTGAVVSVPRSVEVDLTAHPAFANSLANLMSTIAPALNTASTTATVQT